MKIEILPWPFKTTSIQVYSVSIYPFSNSITPIPGMHFLNLSPWEMQSSLPTVVGVL